MALKLGLLKENTSLDGPVPQHVTELRLGEGLLEEVPVLGHSTPLCERNSLALRHWDHLGHQ